MQLADALELLETHLQANWTDTPIAFENVDQRNSTLIGQPLLPAGTTDYVAVRTMLDGSRTITVPARCIRYFGAIYVAVCTLAGTGTRASAAYADRLISLLEERHLSGQAGSLRLGNLTFSTKYSPSARWFVHEIGFDFSFERVAV